MKLRRIIILLIMLAITATLVTNNLEMYCETVQLNHKVVQTQNKLKNLSQIVEQDIGRLAAKNDALTFYVVDNLERKPDFQKLQRANIEISFRKAHGCGTVIGIEEGYTYVLTAKHCTPKKKRVTLEIEIPMKDKDFLKQGKNYLKGHTYVEIKKKNIYRHELYDIALFRFPTIEGHDLEVLLPPKYPPQIGDIVYAVGNPMAITDNITKGIFSAIDTYDGIDYTIVSSGIIFGNSGGAIVNQDGEIIGVVVEIEFDGSHPLIHLGYCVPRHIMIPFVLEAYAYFTKEVSE